jgi:DNA-binding CsgD family transcriptional regulator
VIDDDLVTAIYGVPLGETSWDQVLERLHRTFDCDGGVLMTHHARHTDLTCQCLKGYDDSVWQRYAEHYAAIDPLAQVIGSGRLHSGQILADSDLIDPAAMRRTEFSNDFWRPLGIGHTASGLVLGGDGWQVMLTLTRHARAGAYERPDLHRIQVYFKHLAQAFRLEREILGRRGILDLDQVARLHALTAAEARVLGALAEGGTLRAVAERLGRRYSTIRAQMRSVLEKTGTHSQVELMGLVHRPPGNGPKDEAKIGIRGKGGGNGASR